MNSRERALSALDHTEPDLVPVDLGATIVTSITRTAYDQLRVFLNLAPDAQPTISSRNMDSVYPAEDLLERYQVDFRPVHLRGPREVRPKELPDGSFCDEYDVKWSKASYYYDAVERPLAKATMPGEIAKGAWPNPADPGRVAGLREEVRRLSTQTERLIVADIPCLGPFEAGCVLRGYDHFPMDLATDSAMAEALLDKVLEVDIGLWDAFLDQVGEYVDVVAMGDDLGTQRGLYISPKMYRQYIKPRHQALFGFIRSKTKAKIFLHSCGSVYDLIPDLIETGVQILNPIQRSAAKMDIATLKQEFGRDLCFWGGGIDVQQVLPRASLQEIQDEVRRTIDILAPGGGFVFAACHNLQADVTPERIDCLYKSALKYRS